MEKTFDPQAIEKQLYQAWSDSAAFKAGEHGEAYCILLPPPNVTGTLHMGHGFQQTLMDALIRYHNMYGQKTHWQVGVDHAGIATQMVVEKQLAQRGQTRHDLGREQFLESVWAWKAQSGDHIQRQMKRLGLAADWEQSRFTLDEGMSDAVKQTFVKLYDEGLIYRGQRLVNWDPSLQTALSDLEVINQSEKGHLWHIRYPIADSEESLVIATTRPETLLGDTAVAVHPDDKRYQRYIGQQVRLPLCDRLIPIIADDYVDQSFGSGVVKITPAHDFNDYAVGERHELPIICVMNLDASINEHAPAAYQGLDRFEARQKIIEDLTEADLLVEVVEHDLNLPRGDRSNVILEPMLTPQWFVKTKPLAGPAIEAVKSGKLRFVPENWEKTYFQWLDNIEDWCISRQLWWGHRIPAWYDEAGKVYVGTSEAAIRAKHGLDEQIRLRQEEDVLDTWFSSALWPFSALGWPEQTDLLKAFYPSSVLVTGFDIIFFWVARMVMFGLHFMKAVPFHTVYITGLIRDHEGQKMSKSKGNVLDPIDLIDGISLNELLEKRCHGMMQPQLAKKIKKATEKEFPDGIAAYGTDALRFTYCALASTGRDIRFDMNRLAGYHHFCNKLWNAARFIMMNVDTLGLDHVKKSKMAAYHDRYIQSQLQSVIKDCHQHFADYRFDRLAKSLYDFAWGEFCDWYVEFAKTTLYDSTLDIADKQGTVSVALSTLETLLRLLHPIMPFITEAIWKIIQVPLGLAGDSIMEQAYPSLDEALIDEEAQRDMDWCQAIIRHCRTVRSEMNLNPGCEFDLYLNEGTDSDKTRLDKIKVYLLKLAKIKTVHWGIPHPEFAATTYIGDLKLSIDLTNLVDPEKELNRLNKTLKTLKQKTDSLEKKLANPGFLAKAPPEIVAKEKTLLSEELEKIKKYQAQATLFHQALEN